MKDIYKITISNLKKKIILYFCKRDEIEYEEIKSIEDIYFTNTYIYKDDSIIEVKKKIILEIKKLIQELKDINYEEIYGYLSCEWNYYSNYKILEYLNL